MIIVIALEFVIKSQRFGVRILQSSIRFDFESDVIKTRKLLKGQMINILHR